MNQPNKDVESDLTHLNYFRIRKIIGLLGILLPILLPLLHLLINEVARNEQTWMLPSISHYYYSPMTVLFTGFMITFGVFLIAYKGHKKEEGDKFSDNWVTTIGGACAILTAFFPTGQRDWMIDAPNHHENEIIGGLHFGFALVFLVCMAIMCFFQFTIGQDKYEEGTDTYKRKKIRNRIYRFCAICIIIGISFCGIAVWQEWNLTTEAVFWGEAFAVFFFGIAWFIKGEALKNNLLKNLYES